MSDEIAESVFKEKKDHFWRNLVLAFVFFAAMSMAITTPTGYILVMAGVAILVLEYIHYRYIDAIEKLLRGGGV